MVDCSDFNRVVKPAWILGSKTMKSGLSSRRRPRTSSRPSLCRSRRRIEAFVSANSETQWRASGRSSSACMMRHSSGDRVETARQFTWEPLGLLEVGGRAAEDEADDENLCGDQTGEQRAEFEVPQRAHVVEPLEDDHRGGHG